jgi:chemotaxis-related protein WspB
MTTMLLLLFDIGKEHYALDVNQIIEVVPLVILKNIAAAPDYVAGLMNYRGSGVPVIDLNQLVGSSPSEDVLSTRIIVVKYPVKDMGHKPLGLIATNVTETAKSMLTRPPATGVFMDKSLYAGEVLPETSDMIQWFDIERMLPERETALLYEEEE